ncbi:MAG: Rrf2 family transcriptional regulator [Candidatus Omnitrophota bacterium]|jgi:Rrf2 family protein|nr:MAG: Rrf2 family transcriptional regulator [Candidatus Omnitrophota bacterium]
MRFSKTTDYALRIMVALAVAGEERLSLKALSRREHIPRKFLEHVIRILKDSGLLQSTPGPKGGYNLSQSSSLITVGQILQAVQGPLLPDERLDPENLPEHLKDPIERLRIVINDIRVFARQRLESVTLADLAKVGDLQEARDALMYYI